MQKVEAPGAALRMRGHRSYLAREASQACGLPGLWVDRLRSHCCKGKGARVPPTREGDLSG